MALTKILRGKTGSRHLNAGLLPALDIALALLAPLASPALTGTPTAPTAAPGTNNTQLATTAHVKAANDGALAAAAAAAAVAAAAQPKAGNTFTVATLPDAATNDGRVIYVSNGSAGAPCAAISTGAAWKVIALGADCAAA